MHCNKTLDAVPGWSAAGLPSSSRTQFLKASPRGTKGGSEGETVPTASPSGTWPLPSYPLPALLTQARHAGSGREEHYLGQRRSPALSAAQAWWSCGNGPELLKSPKCQPCDRGSIEASAKQPPLSPPMSHGLRCDCQRWSLLRGKGLAVVRGVRLVRVRYLPHVPFRFRLDVPLTQRPFASWNQRRALLVEGDWSEPRKLTTTRRRIVVGARLGLLIHDLISTPAFFVIKFPNTCGICHPMT
jgi:hypothetical protein